MPTPRMSADEIWTYVIDAHTGVMTTLRSDGVPVSLPLWFVCLDQRIYVRTRGKKLLRIRNDPRASFLVESGERWADLQAVHFTGRAEIVDLDEFLAERFRSEMDRKYAAFRTAPGEMPETTAEHYAAAMTGVVRFTPDARILTWDNAKLVGG
jgi:nitroimidazol reductase NimA-like FMN-containing flavoprotein (pyridoxamine 5'-phosphate oxidase superfamily)